MDHAAGVKIRTRLVGGTLMSQMIEIDTQNHEDIEWLPHLTNEVVADARGPEFAAYVIALEGWRRGLTLKWHVKDSEYFKDMKTWSVDKPGKLFSLSSEDKTHYFFRSRGDKVTNVAVDLASDKGVSKQILIKAGISTPAGKAFKEDIKDNTVIEYAKEIGFPVVIKPTDGSYGRGVITNIENERELEQALTHLRKVQGYKDVLLEQHVPGDEYRVYVVSDKVVGVIKRIPANVIGDGVNTVRSLIATKNKEKVKNPRLITCLINVDQVMIDHIQKQGYTLDSVLVNGEHVYLNGISNISKGGDPIGYTDELPVEVKDLAVQALHAIPGLAHGAVDVIYDASNPITEAAVLELNPTAQIGGLLFPAEGKASDIPAAIIDHYFPETKNNKIPDKSRFYYDFMDNLSPLIDKTVRNTTVTPFPEGTIYAKKYTIKGDVQQIGYHRGLRKQAFERFLHGFVLKRSNGDIEVVVSGNDAEMVDDFEKGIWEDPERSEVKEVISRTYEGPIKVGFEIKLDIQRKEEELEKLRQELEHVQFDLKQAEKQHRNYKESSSWRLTSPIRVLGKLFK